MSLLTPVLATVPVQSHRVYMNNRLPRKLPCVICHDLQPLKFAKEDVPWITSFGHYDVISTKDLVSGQEVSQTPRESNKHGVSGRLQNEPLFSRHPPAAK